MTAALVTSPVLGFAADKPLASVPGSDAGLAQRVRHEILVYPRYSLFDNIGYRVSNGQVELTGAVTQPYKKSDLEHLVRAIPGVTGITDMIKVLPLSPMDDRLRMRWRARSSAIPAFPGMRWAPSPRFISSSIMAT